MEPVAVREDAVTEAVAHDAPLARILVVDDEPMNLLAFGAALESLPNEIVKVDSGDEALRRLLREDFAVVVLDVQMPGIDGFETARLLRMRRKSEHVPIIFLTAINKEQTHVRRGYDLGAVDYLFKPVDPDILRAKVRVFIDLFEQRRRLLTQQRRIHELERERMLEHMRARHEAQLRATEQEARRALAEKAEELARSNAELEQFAYVASHDLQEPLRMVISFTQLLTEQYGPSLDDNGREYLHFAHDGAKRMRRLVRDLLALSRAGGSDAERVPTSLNAVVDEALGILDAPLREAGARVDVAELPQVHVHPAQMVQVFQNLLGNSLKFCTDEPPQLHIGCERDGDMWVVHVADNGSGIPVDFRERAFGMFQRLHPREGQDGSGIGLAIVKKIIERHGGRIWVDPAVTVGTTIRFTLPADEAPALPPTTASVPS